MTPQLKTYLRYSVSILLAGIFLYFAFRGTDFREILSLVLAANYWWIFLMFVFLLLSHAVRAWRWRYLLDPIKSGIGFRNLFSGVMVGYMVNNVVPRGGELIRPYTIGKLEGISKSAAFGTIVVERIIDTFTFLILVAIMPLVYDGPLRETFPWLEEARVWISAVTFGGLAFILALVIRRDWADVAVRVVSRLLPARVEEKVHQLSHSFLDGFLFLKQPKNFALILVQSAAVWFFYICMVWVAFFAFDLHLDFNAAIVVQAISSIGVAVPTPGGTGSYHMFASQTLTQLFGVSNEIALSYATVTHGFGFIGTMTIGLYYFFKDHLRVSEAVAESVQKTA